MSIYIFGYGSLLNPESRKKTFTEKKVFQDVVLLNYQRKINAYHKSFDGYLYLNLVPKRGNKVKGVLVEVDELGLPGIKKRESGYEIVEVTKDIQGKFDFPIFTFIAPDIFYSKLKVLQSYINTCLKGVPSEERDQWVQETIIENEIEDDTQRSKYEFFS